MHNNVLYNAAFCGAFSAINSVPTSASQTGVVATCVAFATEVDELIPNDANLSNMDGTTLVPTTGATQASQSTLPGLLQDICFSAIAGRPIRSTVSENYEGMAASIAAMYAAAKTALATTLA